MIAVQTACRGSIRTVDHLGEIVTTYGKNSDLAHIRLHRTKCTKIITEVVRPALKEDLKKDVEGKHFSLMEDETTDISVTKDLAIIIRYFNEKQRKVTDCLLEIVSVSSATGELIFNAIKKTLDWYCLDLKKCVAFGCDGASVMVGQHSSVWSRIKDVNPSCILMKCICHSLALCVQHGFYKLPSKLRYLLQEIPGWFSQSTIRRDEYKALHEQQNDESTRSTSFTTTTMPFAKFCITRWLSRGKIISAIYKNWAVLQRYFENVTTPTESQRLTLPKVQVKARELLRMVQDNVNHLYITFALPVVTEFERVNALFQSSKANPDNAFGGLDLHHHTLKSRVYDNRGNQKGLCQIDFGAKFMAELNALQKNDGNSENTLLVVKQRFLEMLMACISQVEMRLPEQRNVFSELAAWFLTKFEEWILESYRTST